MDFEIKNVSDVKFSPQGRTGAASPHLPLWEAIQKIGEGQCIVVTVPADKVAKNWSTNLSGFLWRRIDASKAPFEIAIRKTDDPTKYAVIKIVKKK